MLVKKQLACAARISVRPKEASDGFRITGDVSIVKILLG